MNLSLICPPTQQLGLNNQFCGGIGLNDNITRKRRHRTIFKEEQLEILEQCFQENQYPDVSIRERIAEQIDLKEERVEVKFIGKRQFYQETEGGKN